VEIEMTEEIVSRIERVRNLRLEISDRNEQYEAKLAEIRKLDDEATAIIDERDNAQVTVNRLLAELGILMVENVSLPILKVGSKVRSRSLKDEDGDVVPNLTQMSVGEVEDQSGDLWFVTWNPDALWFTDGRAAWHFTDDLIVVS
jgi:chromosome segregation ATPase